MSLHAGHYKCTSGFMEGSLSLKTPLSILVAKSGQFELLLYNKSHKKVVGNNVPIKFKVTVTQARTDGKFPTSENLQGHQVQEKAKMPIKRQRKNPSIPSPHTDTHNVHIQLCFKAYTPLNLARDNS